MLKYGFFHSAVKKCKAWCLALSLTVLFVLGATMQDAYAALNCTVQPTCEELGYDKDYLACPFDSSYIKNLSDEELFPAAKSCADMGFTTDDKSSWCPADKIVSCCDSEDDAKGTYTLCASVSCTDLGYTTDDKTEECATEELEKCPFDETYTRCPSAEAETPTCADLGFTTDDKTEWCLEASIVKCPYDETYTLCKNVGFCQAGSATKVGDCGERGNRGWELDTTQQPSVLGCYPCKPKACPEGTSTSMPECDDGEEVYGIYYSGDSLCFGCTTAVAPTHCSGGSHATLEGCQEANPDTTSGECVRDAFGCYTYKEYTECPAGSTLNGICFFGQTKVEVAYVGGEPCIECQGEASTTPAFKTCAGAGCTDDQYLCDGKCSDTKTSQGCLTCGLGTGITPPPAGGDGGTGGGSGGGGGGASGGGAGTTDWDIFCSEPGNQNSCECFRHNGGCTAGAPGGGSGGVTVSGDWYDFCCQSTLPGMGSTDNDTERNP